MYAKISAKAKELLLVCWEARVGKGVTFVSIILQGNAKYIPPNGASVFYLYSPTWSCAISPLKSSPTFVSDTHYQGFSMRLLIGGMAFDAVPLGPPHRCPWFVSTGERDLRV